MKRILAVLLVLSMLLGTLPVLASAEEVNTGIKDGYTYIVLGPDGYTTSGNWKMMQEKGEPFKYLYGGVNGKNPPYVPASISIGIPKDGEYKLYTLSRDYASGIGERWYEFTLGSNVLRVGSHGYPGWAWQETTPFFMLAGEYDLKLEDSKTSGYNGRCAITVITDDMNFNPGTTAADYKALCERQYKVGDLKGTIDVTGRPSSEIAVKLNGEWMNFDVDPIIVNDRTLVPFRAIFEALGCTVSWDDATQTAIGERNGMKIELPIGKTLAKVSGAGKYLDQPAILHNERTLVPLRFVSESLGAAVQWYDDSQSVAILASIPETSGILFTAQSVSNAGNWIIETDARKSSDGYPDGVLVGCQTNQAPKETYDKETVKPATISFNLEESGTYKVWVHAKDYASNQPGARSFQISFNNGEIMPAKFGTHGENGFKWASGGTVELPAGINNIYIHDTAQYFARFDGIFLTKDMDYVPAEKFADITRIATPTVFNPTPDMPAKAISTNLPAGSASIGNEDTKVVFYKVQTPDGQVVQNEIYNKSNGQWVLTKARDEGLGYLVMSAVEATAKIEQENYQFRSKFEYDGTIQESFGKDPYKAGAGTWFVPNDFVVEGNTVTLLFPENDVASMKAVWSMDNQVMPKVSIDTTFKKDGYYSVVASEGGAEFAREEIDFVLAPYTAQYKRVPAEKQLVPELAMFTPMGTYTLPANNRYSSSPVTKGIVLEPSWIPLRWVYWYNSLFGISLNSQSNSCQSSVFAPVMGTEQSKMAAGQTHNLQFRVVSRVSDWFENYEDISANLFNVHDYRENYNNTLNDVIFNTRDLFMDDKAGGWDPYSKGFYNMEYMSWISQGNPVQPLQEYLLTDDEEILDRRAIPTLASFLTRGNIHFNRTGLQNRSEEIVAPDPLTGPVAGFNANVTGGMYEMTRGGVPFLQKYTLEQGQGTVSNAYGEIPSFVNSLTMYKYTGEQKYLDKAIEAADGYLKEKVYKADTQHRGWTDFIYISYYPNLASLIDIYEVTGYQRYLDAAVDVARWMSTGLWVSGIDGDKLDQKVVANDYELRKKLNEYRLGGETGHMFDFYFNGLSQREVLPTSNLENLTSKYGEVSGAEALMASRVGLGIEQACTFMPHSGHIIMQTFVGDFLKLTAYTGDEYFTTMARNAIIGRFKSYEGYNRNSYLTYQFDVDVAREGPDAFGFYQHHVPVFMAMVEDFLIGQTMSLSGDNIHFPSFHQQGYAYFNSNQYGHKPGKFYDHDGMWPWLDKGIVTTDSIQIDWMAARKDGVMGIAFMNESKSDVTTTATLGDKVPGGATYSGIAELYDATGKIGTVNVTNGKFTLNIPAKKLVAVAIKIDTVKAPSFAALTYSNDNVELGATVSKHINGEGYTLQMNPDNYYAYVYVKDNTPMQVKGKATNDNPVYHESDKPYVNKLTIAYDIGGGEKKTEECSIYPFEFIIKVDDVNKEFNYTLTATMSDGTTQSRGSGTLMTAALSKEKGVVYDENKPQASAPTSTAAASDAAKALKFNPVQIQFSGQGAETGKLRFVINPAILPFEASEKNLIGLPVYGYVIDSAGEKILYNSVIVGYEARSATECVIAVSTTSTVTAGRNVKSGDTWALMIFPYGTEDAVKIEKTKNIKGLGLNQKPSDAPAAPAPSTPSTPSPSAPSGNAPASAFEPYKIPCKQVGAMNNMFRLVIEKSKAPSFATPANMPGLVVKGTVIPQGHTEGIEIASTVSSYEIRESDCVIQLNQVSELSGMMLDSMNGKWDVTLYPNK